MYNEFKVLNEIYNNVTDIFEIVKYTQVILN